MIIRGKDDQSLELKISEHQFPDDAKLQNNDLIWLNVYINVNSKLGNWETVDPSLTTSEFNELIEWFKNLSLNRKVKYTELFFTEPNLEFDLIKNYQESKHIKVIFNAEYKPKSIRGDDRYYIDFELTNSQLAKVSDELENELKKVTC